MNHYRRKISVVVIAQTLWLLGCKSSAVLEAPADTQARKADAVQYFTNPIMDGADPWVLKKDSVYYSCASNNGSIYVSQSRKLTKLGERVPVWKAPATGWNAHNLWAPEIHYLQGKWYIYYAAGKKSGGPFIHQRSGVLESTTDSPFGPYQDKGMLYTGDSLQHPGTGKWAIDLSPFYLNGQLYAVWSGWEQNAATDRTKQHLYLAKMTNPWTIGSNRVKISSPTEAWETGGELDLNEGPELLKKNEKAFLIYSCRESWLKEYRLGQLMLSDTLADPMQASNWTKSSGPVFQSTADVLGVGHCSFTTSPDNTEDWILYHAKKSAKPGWQRDIRMQKFTWTTDGFPMFGEPVSSGVPIPVPSGEK
ncbi:glycoside hydrolase family 43 protein [Rufibacter latericius]|uniref:Glycoside hydrolase n=1 Tax=Rufibacter latericius TaxID=2487040 RepID=A0A3M9MTH2_9BACT|nr:glycoside hydrolase family 43 protein [Rufibacter latericius]RNI28810.1 glycoside hydrolase [Rufibacter latericius]